MYEQRLPIEEWKAKKQAELKETIAAQKSVLQEVVQDGQRLADYLYGRGRLGSHMLNAGKIKAFRIGRSYRIPKVNVIRFLQNETPEDCNTVNATIDSVE